MAAFPRSVWRVLVAEDDRAVASVHCRFVSRQRGFQVVGAAFSGSQARDMVAGQRPDLLLLDLGLPGHTGVDLLRELRSAGSPVDVIVVTAHSAPAIVRDCVQLGVVDYLVKPFWPARLADALARFSGRMQELRCGRPLDQEAIDRVQGASVNPEKPPPSNIKQERLQEVRDVLARHDCSLTAEQVAEAAHVARVTARRYLEHLVELGQCTVDSLPDGPGRPRKAYRLWLSTPVGARTHTARP